MDFTSNSEQNLVIDNIEQINTNNYNQITWFATSILSWFFYLCCQLENYRNTLLISFENELSLFNYEIIILGISLAGFITYLIFTTCKKNQNLYNSMLGKKSKFHFIPLLFASALFIVNIIYEQNISKELYNDIVVNRIIITSLIFSVLTLSTLIYIYIQINIPCEWYLILTIKKGAFSCLIPYILNLMCLEIYNLVTFEDIDKQEIFYKFLYIIKGILSLFFSFILKDIVVALINAFFYIQDLIYYVILLTDIAISFIIFILIVSISFILLTIFLITFLSIKYKEKILNKKNNIFL